MPKAYTDVTLPARVPGITLKQRLTAMNSREVLTVREVAQSLRASEQHVRDLFHEGKLQGYTLGDGKRSPIRVYASSVERFKTAHAAKRLSLPKLPETGTSLLGL